MQDLNPFQLVPYFVKHVLHVGDISAEFKRRYSYGVDKVWNVGRPFLSADPRAAIKFDWILIDCLTDPEFELQSALQALIPFLNCNGWVCAMRSNDPTGGSQENDFDSLLNNFGLLSYNGWAGEKIKAQNARVIIAVHKSYNPVAHARELAKNGLFSCSIDILDRIPLELMGDNKVLALVAAEKQRYYFNWQKVLPSDVPRHKLFFFSRREFAQATHLLPCLNAAYRTLADFWHYMGDGHMADRVLRSIRHVAAEDKTRIHLPTGAKQKPPYRRTQPVPQWSGLQRLPRLLVITHDNSDYGVDTLFDGLCRVLGVQNVTEFPWKPTLHGINPATANNYPCIFNYPGELQTVDQIVQGLADRRFDFIIYADVVQMAYPKEIRRIMDAGRHLPVVLYDPWDNCYTPMDRVLKYIGRESVDLYLKREMLSSIDYGSRAFPLPFGYPDERLADRTIKNRRGDVFWAGKRVWGLRSLYIERVEKLLGRTFNEKFPQAEYAELLQKSLIGLSFFGSGFDTVRYWEIPAHGSMLLAERPPILIPHNFTDGQTAVFFEDLPELEEKLVYYLANPQKAKKIAAAGHRHFLKFHTTTARARQLLGYLEKFFNWC